MNPTQRTEYAYFKPRFPNRAPFEFYPTPPSAIRALLSVERFEGDIWEPACGDGAIGKELVRAGYDVIATDITDWGYGYSGYDFLTLEKPLARNIVTNPPYGGGLADRFEEQALQFSRQTGGRVAMLLNIASLCHPKRHDSFLRQPPSVIYALDDCVCFPLGDPSRATAHTTRHRYAWLIWDHAHTGETVIRWLSTTPFQSARPFPTLNQKGEKQ